MDNQKVLGSVLGCKTCGYYTCNTRDFLRHQSTKKHIAKTSSSPDSILGDDIVPVDSTINTTSNVLYVQKPKKRLHIKHTKQKIDNHYDSDDSDEAIYETIYTNPNLVIREYPKVFDLVLNARNNILMFIANITNDISDFLTDLLFEKKD